MKRSLIVAFVYVFGALAALAAAPSKVMYFRCGKLIYDAEKPPLAPAAVVITDGKVTAVGADLPLPDGVEQIDLSRYTVLAGFVDAHFGSNPAEVRQGPRTRDRALWLERTTSGSS
jgi:cytosine/adenosine deaminase-related metal-dependent hydrolase